MSISNILQSIHHDLFYPFRDNPFQIPQINDIQNIIKKYDKYHPVVHDDQIELLIAISKTFPDLHKYLVLENGIPQFPPFHLPSVYCAGIVRYLGFLLESNSYSQVMEILNFFEDISIKGNDVQKILSDDYILDYLYLLGENKSIILGMLPKHLKYIYDIFFKS